MKPMKQTELTMSELRFLLNKTRDCLQNVESDIECTKCNVNDAWRASDKAIPETKFAFHTLNQSKDELRYLQRQKRVYVSILKKLKDQYKESAK